MKNIVTDIASFPEMIAKNCIYVDKTDILLNLIQGAGKTYFISRPRRFGKSLMLSTLKAIFEGKRELFKDCAIYNSDYDWKTYPVMTIDMSDIRDTSCEKISQLLCKKVAEIAAGLSLTIEENSSPNMMFESLWKAVNAKELQLVVLVDEYDIPLQGFLDNPDEYEKVRQLLHDFYIRFKSHADSIRFLMLTGVTKITKLSLFSGLNTPTDLTFDEAYASLLGYTHEELSKYFSEHIQAFSEKRLLTCDEIHSKLLDWYDHYRFSPNSDICVLNPVSLGHALIRQLFDCYWIDTGKNSMITERLIRDGVTPLHLDCIKTFKDYLNVYDNRSMPIESLLYQGGYLTIKDVDEIGEITLTIPNSEIRIALVNEYLFSQINSAESRVRSCWLNANLALDRGDLNKAISLFRSGISAYPYSWLTRDEGAVKIAFTMFFYPMHHVKVHCEQEMASGRIDAVYESKDNVYIFEFKYNQSAQEAFDQIVNKGYHRPYLASGKAVYGIGLNFNPAENVRGIDDPVVHRLFAEA